MVFKKNVYAKRGRPPKIIASLSNKLEHNRKVHTDNGFPKRRGRPPKCGRTTEVNLIFKNGLFTSNNVTLQETSINNKVLRITLKRHDLNALKEISMKFSSYGRSIKRKRIMGHFSKQNNNYKKVKINGSNVKKQSHIKNLVTETSKLCMNMQSPEKQETATFLEDKQNYNKEDLQNKELQLSSIFDESKFSILMNKHNQKEISRSFNSSDKLKEMKREHSNIKSIHKVKYKVELPGIGKYYLKFKKDRVITQGRLNYKFQKLVMDVKSIKLPTVTWKIKIILKQNKVSSITFTNKQELERSVCFSTLADRFKLVIDNKPAYLLGSPNTIDAPEDIEILLDILEHLEDTSQIILYK